MSSGRSIQLGVPLAFAGADHVDGTSFYLGNLRASLLFGDADDLSGFVGATVPTASNIDGPDLAAIVGGLPWLDEIEKWSDDSISLRGDGSRRGHSAVVAYSVFGWEEPL